MATARELLREGHRVAVFEQSDRIGGVWVYTPEVEDDPLGTDQGRRRLHSSMYAGLRTNLPREVMGFADFPFDETFPGSKDPRQFCSHQEVLAYLEAFAAHFELERWVRFGKAVATVAPVQPELPSGDTANGAAGAQGWPRWEVTTHSTGSSAAAPVTEEYDAVVVCNGHYSEPRVPSWPGQDTFPGHQMHSHSYREPREYLGKVVVIVGAAFSGTDIAQEILEAGADRVVLSAREWSDPSTGAAPDDGPGKGSNRVDANGAARSRLPAPQRVGNVVALGADGSVTFECGTKVEHVDVVMYATGYLYTFPFLQGTAAAPNIEDNRVGPLFGHVFPPAWAPTLAFVGLPWKVVPFPQFELQARWIARCLSGKCTLPPPEAMLKDVELFYASMAAEGVPQRYAHRMQGDIQGEYNRWVSRQCGDDEDVGWPWWRGHLYQACGASRRANGLLFREVPLPEAEEALKAHAASAAELRAQDRALK